MPKAFLRSARPLVPASHASLLATTSLAALLLGEPATAGQAITNQTVASVSNVAGNVTTSIQITGSTVTGAVTNVGTITPGAAVGGATQAIAIINSTVGGGVASSGAITVNAVAAGIGVGIGVNGGSISNGIANSSNLAVSGGATGVGIALNAATLSGGIVNSSAITTTGTSNAAGIAVSNNATVTSNGITNASTGTITANGANTGVGIVVTNAAVVGGITNAGSIIATKGSTSFGIEVVGGTVAGGIVNSGAITVSGSRVVVGINVISNTQNGTASTISGGISNTGTINASVTLPDNAVNPTLQASGLNVVTSGTFTGPIANSGTIEAQGAAALTFTGGGTFQHGGIQVNGEAITASGGLNSPGGQITSMITNASKIGATLGVTSTLSVSGQGAAIVSPTLNGLFVNAAGGTATAVGATAGGGSISGGITNAGTITANLSHMAMLTDAGNAGSFAISNPLVAGISATASGGSNFGSRGVAGGGSLTGDLTNAGSITVSATGNTTVTAPTNGGTSTASTSAFGILLAANGGFSQVSATQAMARGGNFTGNITNAGTIIASVVASENGSGQNSAFAVGLNANANAGVGQGAGGTFTGAILNSGMIIATASGSGNAIGVFAPASANLVQAAGIATSANGGINDAVGGGGLVTTDITNAGLVSASAKAVGQILSFATGISVAAGGGVANSNAAHSTGGIFRGNIVNNGTIVVSATAISAANAQAILPFAAGGNATAASSSATGGTLIGNVVNNGMIAVSVSGTAGSIPASGVGILIGFINPVEKNGGVATPGTIIGSVLNAGSIQVNASGQGEMAVGIAVGTATKAIVHTGVFTGAIVNSGTVSALGTNGAVGIGIAVVAPVLGGITNTGTITGNSAAIDLSQEVGGASVVNQAGGALVGSVIGSGNAKADVLNVTGGQIVLSGAQSISGFGTYNQTGGTLVFNVTQSTAPGTYPTLSAGTINLRGGTFELVPAAGSLFGLAAQGTTVFKNIIAADPPLSGSFASITTPITLFSASLSPDATTANALDATLSLSQAGLAASAQDLTQDARLGLDAPRVLTSAIQDRLVANGGALGEWAPGPASGAVISKGPVSYSLGNANVWARGYDQFGTATASPASAGVGYDINRAAPVIAGIDWRLENNIVAGVAATYVATSAKFKDGSSTNMSSYQGGAYAGWSGGPWYAFGSVVASFNDFGTSRLLTPFGLPGDATSSPSGQSYQGHAEAGYHWALAAAGVNVSLTPYAALDYVNAHVDGFSETGGFGALSVNATDGNSFQTTLGLRLTSRIAMASGTLTPELRLGWSHEFLDASQQITAALVGIPGSTFSATGIAFGRDAALIGAGLSFELSPDAKVFVDYDGKLGSRLQEHSVSGGLRIRF